MLLYYGGFELQDIFYSIPNAEKVKTGESPYIKVMQVLEAYFKPKMNTAYEKHIVAPLNARESADQYWVHPEAQPLTGRSVNSCI